MQAHKQGILPPIAPLRVVRLLHRLEHEAIVDVRTVIVSLRNVVACVISFLPSTLYRLQVTADLHPAGWLDHRVGHVGGLSHRGKVGVVAVFAWLLLRRHAVLMRHLRIKIPN